ncbi:MAG: amino acid--tRNA ligase-related protein, partial [Pseudomonadales bacterium]
LVIDGVEIANGYWELLDVAEHRARFKRDLAVRQARGLAARPVDEAFLAAIEHGLPACAGVALGFDRLVMRALGVDDIESVLAFRY